MKYYVVVSRSTDPYASDEDKEWVVCCPWAPADKQGSEPVYIDEQTGRYAIYVEMSDEQRAEWERPTAALREWKIVEVEI